MSLNIYSHLSELKWRLFYVFLSFILSFAVLFYFRYHLLYCIANPLLSLFQDSAQIHKSPLIFTHVIEAFYSFLQLAIIIALFVTFPLFLYFLKLFVQPGLFKYELKRINYFYFTIFIFYIFFSYVLFYYIMPYCYYFFVTFGSSHLLFLAKFNEFIQFYSNMFTLFLIALFLPIAIFAFLLYTPQLFSYFAFSRHYIFLAILGISALVTPPDVISLIFLSIPLYLLLELSFFLFFLSYSWNNLKD